MFDERREEKWREEKSSVEKRWEEKCREDERKVGEEQRREIVVKKEKDIDKEIKVKV